MATKAKAAPAVPAIPAELAGMFQQFLASQAKAPAKAAQVEAPVQATVTQLGKSWSSKQGNKMVAVRGTLPDGSVIGGNLWIKQS